jgi:hypothetical protein
MKHHIDAAPQLFVFWCDHSAQSLQVRREFTYALTRNKRVVPVLLDDTALAPELVMIHGIDLRRAIHHDSDRPLPEAPSPRAAARPALSILGVLVALGIVAALTVVDGPVSLPSPGVWASIVTVITLVLLVRYLVKSRLRPAVSERTEDSGGLWSQEAYDTIVSQFSRYIDESSAMFRE